MGGGDAGSAGGEGVIFRGVERGVNAGGISQEKRGIKRALGPVIRSLPEPKLDTPRFGVRVAPFGNAGEGPLSSQLPHFHFRIGPRLRESYPGFGWKWHHPWDDFSRILNLLKK